MTSLLDPIRPPFGDPIVALFHNKYHAMNGLGEQPPLMYWRGYSIMKPPTDMWLYQELIVQEKPDFIIELGTCSGGSALFFADVCSLIDHGRVITVDWSNNDTGKPTHDRLRYLTGDTRDEHVATHAGYFIPEKSKCFLILDASHDYQEVKVELDIWVPLLNAGDVLVVEDTDLGGPEWGLELFRKESSRVLEPIPGCDKFMLTYNPRGYWRMLN